VNLYIVPLTAISGFNGSTLNFSYSSVSAAFTFSEDSVTINKIPGTVSTLSNLTATHSTTTDVPLTPTFDSDVTSYFGSVAYPVSSILLVPTKTDVFLIRCVCGYWFDFSGLAVAGNQG